MIMEEKLLMVIPSSLCKLFIFTAHDKASRQGLTIHCLSCHKWHWHGKGYNILLLILFHMPGNSAHTPATDHCFQNLATGCYQHCKSVMVSPR